jgi:SSS family solute:Na+ symporter
MMGTAISSITFLAYSGSAYAGNWSRLVPSLTLPIAAAVAGYLLVVFYRRTLFVSAFQYFERRFGNWGRSYTSLVWSLASINRMGAILYLMALPMQLMTGWSVATVMIAAGLLITVYTIMGGLEAVIWTDVLQTIVLALGGLLTVALVLARVPGGFEEVVGMASSAGKFEFSVSFDFNFVRDTFWVLMLNGLIVNMQGYATDQTNIQRYAAAKSDRSALGAIWTMGLGCIPIWLLFGFVGSCIWVFYQVNPDPQVAALRADTVYPHFMMTQMPPFIGGLVLSALLAAAMSSIDSSMNGTATVLTVDFYQRHFVKGKDDSHYLQVARIITAALGVLMVLVAYGLWHLGAGSILDTLMFVASVIGGGIGGLFFLGFLTNRVSAKAAAAGLVMGILAIIWCTLSRFGIVQEPFAFNVHPFMIIVVGNVVVFAAGLIASAFFPAPKQDEIVGMTWWTREQTGASV